MKVLLIFLVLFPSLLLAKEEKINTASVFVSPRAKDMVITKVAVLPFKAPIELAGASIADVFTTEIQKTYKYRLIERDELEEVLGENNLGVQGVLIVDKLFKSLGS